jgi:hypothetical protein
LPSIRNDSEALPTGRLLNFFLTIEARASEGHRIEACDRNLVIAFLTEAKATLFESDKSGCYSRKSALGKIKQGHSNFEIFVVARLIQFVTGRWDSLHCIVMKKCSQFKRFLVAQCYQEFSHQIVTSRVSHRVGRCGAHTNIDCPTTTVLLAHSHILRGALTMERAKAAI